MLFKRFDAEIGVTEVILIDESENYKSINLNINSVSSDHILEIITEQYSNILKLKYNDINLTINDNKCFVSRINFGGDIELITELVLENIPVDTLEMHNNESLGSDVAIAFDAWWDPKINPEKIPLHTGAAKKRLAETNYRHNLIIQFEGDEIVSKSVANLIGKHPDMTTVIQYDLEHDRYRVGYGDINKVPGERTRWFLIGHGRTDRRTKKRTFARKTAQYIVAKLKDLKHTEFNNSDPEKIVLLGCKLGQARIEDNFALDISQHFWYEGFSSIITAYTKDLHICHNGRRIVYLNEYESSRKDARYYKTIFNKEMSPMGIQINHEILINYILREINLGNISLDSDIIKNSDYVKQYFYLPNGKLDIDLLKLVALDSRAYHIFVDYMHETKAIYGGFNVNGLIEKLYNQKIFDTPLWKTVNHEAIRQNLYKVDKNGVKKIIFRFSDQEKYRQQAELIASENPVDNFIFQVDKHSKRIILEYGQLDKLKNIAVDKWILLGNIEQHDANFLFEGMTVKNVVDVMDNIHKQHLLTIPTEISFFNKNALGKLSNPYDVSAFASQLAIQLGQENINTNVTTYQVNLDPFPISSSDGVSEYFHLVNDNKLTKFRYNQTSEQLFYNDLNITQAFLMDTAKENIDIDSDFENYLGYLNKYLLDPDGNLITNRVKTIIYDPIISRKVNNYFLHNMDQQPNASDQWQKIFSINDNEALNVKVNNINTLLESLYYRPETINHLSDYSNSLLTELYSRTDGSLDIGGLMLLVNDHQHLNQLQMSLTELTAIDERSGLNQLPLKQSLIRIQQWHQYYFNNILSLIKISKENPNVTIKPLLHAFYFDKNINLGKYIGLFYALTSNNAHDLNLVWQYHRDLIEISSKRKLSISEQQFINNFNELVDLTTYIADNKGILEDQQQLTFSASLASEAIGKYQLSFDHVVFTIIIADNGDGYYQCKIFDPRMGEIKINQLNKTNIDSEVISYIRNYLNDDIIIDNNNYKRYEFMGLTKEAVLNDQFKLQKITDSLLIKTKGNNLIDKVAIDESILTTQTDITIADSNISLQTLQQAGAHIENRPISSFAIRNIANWQTKIKFDAEKLNDYLILFQGTKEHIDIIKFIKQKIKLLPNQQDILLTNSDLNDYSIAIDRLNNINHYDEPQLMNRKLWQNLKVNMAGLPRYSHILNKVSNLTQLMSFIQLVSSTQSTLSYLNNSDLSANERQHIEKNLIIAWGAGIVNWGAEILQPRLLKSVSQMIGMKYSANLFAAKLSMGMNIATSGFDFYYAYENFSQLSYETDPAIRQDLIVNGTISLLSAGVSISSALAMLAGASSAGPIGVAIGAGLMVGGMFYNAYRTVERIKANIQLTAMEEFQTGLNAALGLQAGYSVRNKLLKQQTASALKADKIENEKDLFINVLKPAGFNLSISVSEEEKIVELPCYHLFDKQTNLYLLKNKQSSIQYDLEYLKKDLSFLSLSVNLWKQQQLEQVIEASKRKFTAEEVRKIIAQYPERYLVEPAKLKTYIPINAEGDNEVLMLSREHDNLIKLLKNKPYLDNYLFSNVNAIYSLSGTDQPEFIYENSQDYLMKGGLKRKITGINFNFGYGDDIIVGLAEVKNRFLSYGGHKIFIGGKQDDTFILLGEKIGENEYKYFNADNGNDTLIIAQLPRYHSKISLEKDDKYAGNDVMLSLTGTFINLEEGSLRFLNEPYFTNFNNIELLIDNHNKTDVHADLVSFENVIGIKNKQDVILANDKDNILNGNGGIDIIYGKGGKDTIILNNGYANGGEEQDTYIIERYSWNEYIASMAWQGINYIWDADNEKWINVIKNNNNITVIIDENEFKAKSIVNLDYQLDELSV
ncbi:MAG TPA: C80 family cysteine peptidase [Arsenophonus apicola]